MGMNRDGDSIESVYNHKKTPKLIAWIIVSILLLSFYFSTSVYYYLHTDNQKKYGLNKKLMTTVTIVLGLVGLVYTIVNEILYPHSDCNLTERVYYPTMVIYFVSVLFRELSFILTYRAMYYKHDLLRTKVFMQVSYIDIGKLYSRVPTAKKGDGWRFLRYLVNKPYPKSTIEAKEELGYRISINRYLMAKLNTIFVVAVILLVAILILASVLIPGSDLYTIINGKRYCLQSLNTVNLVYQCIILGMVVFRVSVVMTSLRVKDAYGIRKEVIVTTVLSIVFILTMTVYMKAVDMETKEAMTSNVFFIPLIIIQHYYLVAIPPIYRIKVLIKKVIVRGSNNSRVVDYVRRILRIKRRDNIEDDEEEYNNGYITNVVEKREQEWQKRQDQKAATGGTFLAVQKRKSFKKSTRREQFESLLGYPEGIHRIREAANQTFCPENIEFLIEYQLLKYRVCSVILEEADRLYKDLESDDDSDYNSGSNSIRDIIESSSSADINKKSERIKREAKEKGERSAGAGVGAGVGMALKNKSRSYLLFKRARRGATSRDLSNSHKDVNKKKDTNHIEVGEKERVSGKEGRNDIQSNSSNQESSNKESPRSVNYTKDVNSSAENIQDKDICSIDVVLQDEDYGFGLNEIISGDIVHPLPLSIPETVYHMGLMLDLYIINESKDGIIERSTTPPSQTTLPTILRHDYLRFYKKFIMQDSVLAINISASFVDPITRAFEQQVLTLGVFDMVLDEVLNSLYINTFSIMLKRL